MGVGLLLRLPLLALRGDEVGLQPRRRLLARAGRRTVADRVGLAFRLPLIVRAVPSVVVVATWL
eukprot:5667929-Pyramimonas_sp.AAC.1